MTNSTYTYVCITSCLTLTGKSTTCRVKSVTHCLRHCATTLWMYCCISPRQMHQGIRVRIFRLRGLSLPVSRYEPVSSRTCIVCLKSSTVTSANNWFRHPNNCRGGRDIPASEMNHRLSLSAATRVPGAKVPGSESVNSAARRQCKAVPTSNTRRGPLCRLSHSSMRGDWIPLQDILSPVFKKQAAPIPASGNRNNTSGGINNVGSNGNYWSSSPNSATNGYNLNFNSTNVNPSNSNNRTNGFTVRCLRAFTISREGEVFFYAS